MTGDSRDHSALLGSALSPTGLAAVAAAWLVVHPYRGLIHDARLYLLQALRILSPDTYDQDLFFAFGSQDVFTAFPWLHARVLEALGTAHTGWLLTLLGQGLWLTGALAWSRRLSADRRERLWGLLAVAALPALYGPFGILSYGEGFVTARLYGEALTLWALSFAPTRIVPGVLLCLAAMVLHPIYGAIGLGAVLLTTLASDRRYWLAGALGGLAFVALGMAGVAPFSALFETMDPAWRAVAAGRNAICFPTRWGLDDWAAIAIDALLVALSASTFLGRARRLLIGVGALAAAGTAASLLGDLSDNVLLIQTQPYRALWLLKVASNFCLGAAAYRLTRERQGRPIFILLALASIFRIFPLFAAPATLAACLLGWRFLGAARRRPPNWIEGLAYVGMIGVAGLFTVFGVMNLIRDIPYALALGVDGIRGLLAVGPIHYVLAACAVVFWRPSWTARLRPQGPWIAAAALATGCWLWDGRTTFERELEAGRGFESLQASIPATATVYWRPDRIGDRDSQFIWFGLERRPYLALAQGAGVIFSRETAAEWARRADRLQPIVKDSLRSYVRALVETIAAGPAPTAADLQAGCRAAAGLDYVVLSEALADSYAARWTPRTPPVPLLTLDPNERKDYENLSFYLYDCARYR